MGWRDIVVGAVVTLTITIAAGIAVWFLTREPTATERLIFSAQELASLTADQATINVVVIRVANEGNKTAHKVKAIIRFAAGLEISEAQITSSVGPSNGTLKSLSLDNRELNVETDTLVPNEILSATLLVRGENHSEPEIGVRSTETVGRETDPSREVLNKRSGVSTVVATAVAAGALLLQALLYLFRDYIQQLFGRYPQVYKDSNDAAFLLAHKQLPEIAEKILRGIIFSRKSGPFELANYALALALLGSPEYNKYFEAAEGWDGIRRSNNSTRLKAVIQFNRATISIFQGNLDEAERHLSSALATDKREVVKYCGISDYVQDAIKRSPKIAEVMETSGK